ncbi:MAG: hypothetical protein RLZ13_2041 [Bacteroidota bacterium]|jgi:uncharacterized protein (DUF1800 family)
MKKPKVLQRSKKVKVSEQGSYRTLAGLQQFAAAWDESTLRHLLRRTLFGFKQDDLNALKGKSMAEVVQLLVTPSQTPLPPINNYNDANFSDPTVPAGQTWVNAPYDGNANGRRNTSLKSWWLGNLLQQTSSVHEKMTLFWHNHFAVEAVDVNDARYMYKYYSLLRKYALGNFKELVLEITKDPAMLRYLNGYQNNKNAPDENYARELQELFTLGKGPLVFYTEADVRAAARVLTGYTVNATTISSAFDPNRHDTGNKQFSTYYQNKVILGKTGANGAKETEELIDMLFLQDEIALHLCRKLYRFFVYYEIDAATEANVIVPMANLFSAKNYEIKPVLELLFSSTHFYDPVNVAGMIKSPLDYCVGLCKEFKMQFPDATDFANQYLMFDYIRTQASNMQQNLADPPSVAGWPAYYQAPQFHELWINSDTLPRRNQFMNILLTSGYTRNGKKIFIDVLTYVNALPNPGNPNLLIRDTVAHLCAIGLTTEVIQFLKSILLSGQSTDSYWTDAWTSYKANPTNVVSRNMVLSRLNSMFSYLMNLPEYQLS